MSTETTNPDPAPRSGPPGATGDTQAATAVTEAKGVTAPREPSGDTVPGASGAVSGATVVSADGESSDAMAPAAQGAAPGSTVESAVGESSSATVPAPTVVAAHTPADPDSTPTTDPAPGRGSVIASEQGLLAEADADPWHRFATGTSTVDHHASATRLRRVGRGVWRVVRHEWTLASLACLALATAMTWPALANPAHTVPHDAGDPLVSAYLINRAGHTLITDPAGLFTLNTFFGERLSYAFGDTLLGFAPAGMIGSGPAAALITYNILYVLCVALAAFGGYALLRQLGSRVPGAAFGAVALAFAPWRLAQAGHLQVIAVGGILLSLAMLARGHGWSMRHGYRPSRTRWGWVAAGWGVAAWQITLGFGMGVPFGYLLAGIVLVTAIAWLLRKRPSIPGRVLLADGIGAFVFAGVAAALAIPYYRVVDTYPYAATDLGIADRYSPSWLSFITSPAESWLWGGLHSPARATMYWPAETTLLVGFTLLGLALAGFLYSSWTRRQRWFLAVGLAVAVALTMGTNFLDDGEWAYAALHHYLPGFGALRVSGRLILYVTLVMAILAAGTVSKLGDRLHDMALERHVDPRHPVHRPVLTRLALFIPVALVLVEGVSVAAHPVVPPVPAALSTVQGPTLVLPSSQTDDALVMLWSTQDYPEVVNGTGTFVPENQGHILDIAVSFPQANAVSALRQLGITSVIVRKSGIAGTSWQHVLDFPPTDASVHMTDLGDYVLFALA